MLSFHRQDRNAVGRCHATICMGMGAAHRIFPRRTADGTCNATKKAMAHLDGDLTIVLRYQEEITPQTSLSIYAHRYSGKETAFSRSILGGISSLSLYVRVFSACLLDAVADTSHTIHASFSMKQ